MSAWQRDSCIFSLWFLHFIISFYQANKICYCTSKMPLAKVQQIIFTLKIYMIFAGLNFAGFHHILNPFYSCISAWGTSKKLANIILITVCVYTFFHTNVKWLFSKRCFYLYLPWTLQKNFFTYFLSSFFTPMIQLTVKKYKSNVGRKIVIEYMYMCVGSLCLKLYNTDYS